MNTDAYLRHEKKSSTALAFLTIAILGFSLTHIYASSNEADLNPALASSAEQKAIFSAVLDSKIDFDGLPPPPPEPGKPAPVRTPRPIVLLTTTIALCDSAAEGSSEDCERPDFKEMITGAYVDQRIPTKLRLELLAANKRSAELIVGVSERIQRASRHDINEILKEANGWKSFYVHYPRTAGVVEASRAVLSADRTHALIYVSQSCGGTCGSGYLHYLVHSGKHWKIEISSSLWVS